MQCESNRDDDVEGWQSVEHVLRASRDVLRPPLSADGVWRGAGEAFQVVDREFNGRGGRRFEIEPSCAVFVV